MLHLRFFMITGFLIAETLSEIADVSNESILDL